MSAGLALAARGTLAFTPALPPVNTGEALRYAQAGGGDGELTQLLSEVVAMTRDFPAPRLVYRVFDRAEALPFPIASETLRSYLADCREVILLAATAGHAFDRLSHRLSLLSLSRALLCEGLGSERVEAICDAFSQAAEEAAAADGRHAKPRISPGYGDIPLSLQKDILPALDATARIGLSHNESLLLLPKKSVTAIVGIRKDPK